MRVLVAIPVYNEERYVRGVLARVLRQTRDVLVIDDGSTDETPRIVAQFPVHRIQRESNRGYGRSMRDAFSYGAANGYDWVITMDCDEQHEPASIPAFVEGAARDDLDIVSGSRYLARDRDLGSPPPDRRAINAEITREINRRLGLCLTDAFCGFKAYRVSAVADLPLTEDGYAFPMQFWVRAVAAGLRIGEIPVRLIYNDPDRSFGGALDDPAVRLTHYRKVLHCELERCAGVLPPGALDGVSAGCREHR